MVPTNRPVKYLSDCIDLGSRTGIPLIVACSKWVTKYEVIEAAEQEKNEKCSRVDSAPATG